MKLDMSELANSVSEPSALSITKERMVSALRLNVKKDTSSMKTNVYLFLVMKRMVSVRLVTNVSDLLAPLVTNYLREPATELAKRDTSLLQKAAANSLSALNISR